MKEENTDYQMKCFENSETDCPLLRFKLFQNIIMIHHFQNSVN